jgi:hypothetical protein
MYRTQANTHTAISITCVCVCVCVRVCVRVSVRMDFRAFLALAVDADERLVPSPCPFIPTDRPPGTYMTWGKMLCRVSLEAVRKIKLMPFGGIESRLSVP